MGGIARLSQITPCAAVQTRASARLAEHALRARRVWTASPGVISFGENRDNGSSAYFFRIEGTMKKIERQCPIGARNIEVG